MRIGLISGEYPPMQGGVGAFTQRLAQNLARQGDDVFVFSGKDACQQAGDPPLHSHTYGWHWRLIPALRSWISQNQIDIINLQYQTAAYNMSPWIHFIPYLPGAKPVVTTFHDLRFPYLFPKAGPLRPWIVDHLAKTSGGVIVTNDEDYHSLTHIPDRKLIPIGSNILAETIPPSQELAYRQKAGVKADELLLAYFGFMNHSKGVDTLLEAAANLLQEGLHLRVLMIGGRTGASDASNHSYAAMIDEKISALKLGQHVTWTGYAEDSDVHGYLCASDLVVLPFRDGASYRRGSLMAAIAAGSTIITTEAMHAVPAFVHEQNMFLVTPDSPSALMEAIRHLQANPALRQQLSAGAKVLAQHFDWAHIAQASRQYYAQVLLKQRAEQS